MTPVLFVRADSVYKRLGADCYDAVRDARTFDWRRPAIMHPPCRAWGNFSWNSKHTPEEKLFAVRCLHHLDQVGGILEHPKTSKLWQYLTPHHTYIDINQCDWGHGAQKATRLVYNKVGVMPPLPPPYLGWLRPVENMGVKEREETPVDLAKWLLLWMQS